MDPAALEQRILKLAAAERVDRDEVRAAVDSLLDGLEAGAVRAASHHDGSWRTHPWVKSGILLGFRHGVNRVSAVPPVFAFRDRDTFPTLASSLETRNVRIVPGGTSVRRGAYLGEGIVIMPPAYVNVGAWIGPGTMVDSHALVGSCAQVGARVHLSAAAQIGGVLEPVGALPVIVEDEVFVGGNCGVYEGTLVEAGAVLAAGVVLTHSVRVFDLVRERELRAAAGEPLTIPAGAVVVPGSRPAAGEFAQGRGLHLQAPMIVKYRDASTSASAALEEALR